MIRARLYEQGFTGYVALADELRGMGLSVSKSALGRYGKRLESEVRSAEVLQMVGGRGHGELAEAVPDSNRIIGAASCI